MKPNVLISRDRSRSKPFVDALEQYVDKIICQTFIKFEFLDLATIPESEWLFFYSQKGVEAFHQVVRGRDWKIDHKIAAFGPRTAAYLHELGYATHFIGTGSGKTTARLFEPLTRGENVTIVQGLNSKDSLRKNYIDPSNLKSLVIYKNEPHAVVIKENPRFLCFTSPMNLETYFTVNSFNQGQEVICIGSSTAESAIKQGISHFHISKDTSIISLAEAVISLLREEDNDLI